MFSIYTYKKSPPTPNAPRRSTHQIYPTSRMSNPPQPQAPMSTRPPPSLLKPLNKRSSTPHPLNSKPFIQMIINFSPPTALKRTALPSKSLQRMHRCTMLTSQTRMRVPQAQGAGVQGQNINPTTTSASINSHTRKLGPEASSITETLILALRTTTSHFQAYLEMESPTVHT